MLGAIIGDIAGSRFEWHNIKRKDFELLTRQHGCRVTDDSVMTLAVARGILFADGSPDQLSLAAGMSMVELGNAYPRAGYGGRFSRWLQEGALRQEVPAAYGSYGNGAAMRVSPCGWAAGSLAEAQKLADIVTNITHNHPESRKAAQAVVSAIWLARKGSSLPEIREYIEAHYYKPDFTLDSIRPDYTFDVTCQGSVPQALEAFFESTGFEDTIRNAVSIGGDSDTIAAIAGGIAEAYYGIPADLRRQALTFLDGRQLAVLTAFEEKYGRKDA